VMEKQRNDLWSDYTIELDIGSMVTLSTNPIFLAAQLRSFAKLLEELYA
jgi:hypothetical protein